MPQTHTPNVYYTQLKWTDNFTNCSREMSFFYENLAIFLNLFTALNETAASYLVKIKALIVALMQTNRTPAVHSHSRRSCRGVMGVRMVGVMQYQISHAASIHSSWPQSAYRRPGRGMTIWLLYTITHPVPWLASTCLVPQHKFSLTDIVVCRPADIVNCHTTEDREIEIYVWFSLAAWPMILIREDHIRAMP